MKYSVIKNLLKKSVGTILATLIFVAMNSYAKSQITSESTAYKGIYAGVSLGFVSRNNRDLNTTSDNLQYCTTAQGCTSGFINSQVSASGATQSFLINKSNFIGGGQLGYNLMLHDHYLVGVETDIQGISSGNQNTSFSTTSSFIESSGLPQNIITNLNVSRDVSYLGTLRARLGYTFGHKLLLSGTGGLAYGGVNSTSQLYQSYGIPGNSTSIASSWSSTGNYSKTRTGWTLGALCEYLLRTNWSLKLEFLYFDLGSITYADANLVDLITVPNNPQDFFTNTMKTTTHFNGTILRLGVNYHFA